MIGLLKPPAEQRLTDDRANPHLAAGQRPGLRRYLLVIVILLRAMGEMA